MDQEHGSHPVEGEAPKKKYTEVVLKEGQRDLLLVKQGHYRGRIEVRKQERGFVAPERSNDHYAYYDALAKEKAVSLLLENGRVTLSEVQSFVEEDMRNFWNDSYRENLDSANHVIADHLPLVTRASENAMGVIDAYNEGQMDKLLDAQLP